MKIIILATVFPVTASDQFCPSTVNLPTFLNRMIHRVIIFCYVFHIQSHLTSFYWGLALFCGSACKKFLSVCIGNRKVNVKANIKMIPYNHLQNIIPVLGRFSAWDTYSTMFWLSYFGLNSVKAKYCCKTNKGSVNCYRLYCCDLLILSCSVVPHLGLCSWDLAVLIGTNILASKVSSASWTF